MKALLFDMDGVLIDVHESYRVATKLTAEFFTKKEVTPELIADVKRAPGFNNDWKATEEVMKRQGVTNVPYDDIVAKFQEYYMGDDRNGLIAKEIWVMDKKLIKKLSNTFKIGIITGRPRDEAEFALENADAKELFPYMLTMDDTEPQKFDPILIKMALEDLECDDGYYVGDMPGDMTMANEAGIAGIGVIPPGMNESHAPSLEEAGAKIVLNNINDIEGALQ